MESGGRMQQVIKEIYRKVLEDLLLEKEFQDITTTEIITASGLSRTTFYKHFSDKYELAQWEFEYLLNNMVIGSREIEDSGDNIRSIVDLVAKKRPIYQKMLKYSGQNSFEETYLKVAMDAAYKVARESGRELSAENQYVVLYHATGLLQVLKTWILSDDMTTSPAKIADIIINNRSDDLKSLLYS